MRKNLNYLSLMLVGAISLGLTACQNEDFIADANNSSSATAPLLDERSQAATLSVALTATNNFSIYDFGYGACNVSKNGNVITISNFKAD